MECQGARILSREHKQGEEIKNGNGYRNSVGDNVDNDDDTQSDLGASRKSPVKSWVQRKRDSFELMCASRNESLHIKENNQKTKLMFSKQDSKKDDNKTGGNNVVSTFDTFEEDNFCGPQHLTTKETIKENQEKLDENDENFSLMNVSKDDKMDENVQLCISGEELMKETSITDSMKTEEKVSDLTDELHFEDKPHNETIVSDDNELNIDRNYNKSMLSRDEAIKLSTNASGTSQPRLSTKTGSKLLIKHEETDSTCKDDRTDKRQDKNDEKVCSSVTIIKKQSDLDLETIPTGKTNESTNLAGKQTIVPTFGSKDPVVKKMVYNQYREMLRKYTQASRL